MKPTHTVKIDGLEIRVMPEMSPVPFGQRARIVAENRLPIPAHDCDDYSVPYVSDGRLGHGWECGLCGEFLQAG